MGELNGDILFSGIRPTRAFLRRYTGLPQPLPVLHLKLCCKHGCLCTSYVQV